MQQPSMISRPDLKDKTPDVETAAQVGDGQGSNTGWRSWISTISIVIAAPLMAFLIIGFVFQTYQVDGTSMVSTLQDKDRLIVDKIPRTLARITHHTYLPHRGDIVIVDHPAIRAYIGTSEGTQIIKRVIGLPGDHIVVNNGKITIFNAKNPGGFNPDAGTSWSSVTPFTIGNVDLTLQKGQVFVCGDNRSGSLDSRTFGAIDASEIIGRLAFRVYPIDKFKSY